MEIKQKLITKHFTPKASPKKGIILHWSTTKTLQQIYDTFMGTRKASAHYGIGEDGEIWQFVKDGHIAWHVAGQNYYNIGIEHCGGYLLPDGSRAMPTQACMDASAELIKFLSDKYEIPLTRQSITGHNDYVPTGCPGTLNIEYIIYKANNMNLPSYNDFLQWNVDIETGGLVSEVAEVKTKDGKIPLVKYPDSLSDTQKLFLRQLKWFNDNIPKEVQNTAWLDTIMARYGGVYFPRSNGR